MAVIGFTSKGEQDWFVSRWVFHQLFEDVAANSELDPEMASELKQAEALDGLHLDMLEAALASRVERVLERVVTGIVAGTIQSGVGARYGDPATQTEYRSALQQLLGIVRSRRSA
jgi:hypothetical protein